MTNFKSNDFQEGNEKYNKIIYGRSERYQSFKLSYEKDVEPCLIQNAVARISYFLYQVYDLKISVLS